jgi:hypothetical protein
MILFFKVTTLVIIQKEEILRQKLNKQPHLIKKKKMMQYELFLISILVLVLQ